MNLLFEILVPFLTIACSGAISIGLMHGVRHQWRRRFREPFHHPILRPPGWGCLERRESLLLDLFGQTMAIPLMGAVVGYLVVAASFKVWFSVLLVVAPVSLWLCRRIWQDAHQARREKLGFLGECQVAESLAPLIADGWRIFHDVPMEVAGRKFNLDHVAVGPRQLVVVETKTYSKSRKPQPHGDCLRIEGETVVHPNGRRQQPLRQAKGQAAALRDWLRDQEISVEWVEAVVVLPGWEISYLRDASRQIRDPRNVVAWMQKLPPQLPSPSTQAAAEALEKRCRVLSFER